MGETLASPNMEEINLINSEVCEIWLKPSSNLYYMIKNLFNFFFGANFTQPVAKFLGLFSLLVFLLLFPSGQLKKEIKPLLNFYQFIGKYPFYFL